MIERFAIDARVPIVVRNFHLWVKSPQANQANRMPESVNIPVPEYFLESFGDRADRTSRPHERMCPVRYFEHVRSNCTPSDAGAVAQSVLFERPSLIEMFTELPGGES